MVRPVRRLVLGRSWVDTDAWPHPGHRQERGNRLPEDIELYGVRSGGSGGRTGIMTAVRLAARHGSRAVILPLAALAAATAVLAGCGAAPTLVRTVSSKAASGSTPSAALAHRTTSPPVMVQATTVVPLVRCVANQLTMTVGAPSGAAGSVYMELTFTNTSASPCTLYGYSGASFADSPGGAKVGATAERRPGRLETVTLGPPDTAHETLQVVNAQDYPLRPAPVQCGAVQVSVLRVYPPDQVTPGWIPVSLQGCSNTSFNTVKIWPVRPA